MEFCTRSKPLYICRYTDLFHSRQLCTAPNYTATAFRRFSRPDNNPHPTSLVPGDCTGEIMEDLDEKFIATAYTMTITVVSSGNFTSLNNSIVLHARYVHNFASF